MQKITADMTATAVFRRLLHDMYRLIAARRGDALQGRTVETIHDIRVGLRRSREIVRLMRECAPAAGYGPLVRRLSAALKRLGPLRDTEAWDARMRSAAVVRGCKSDRKWRPYRQYCRQNLEDARREFSVFLRSKMFTSLMRGIRDAVGRTGGRSGAGRVTFGEYAGELLRGRRKRLKRACAGTDLRRADHLHRLRKRVRRERYRAEFIAPLHGAGGKKIVARLKAVTNALGGLHDCDVALERLKREPVPPPKGLARCIRRQRRDYGRKFRHSWEKCVDTRMKRLTQSGEFRH